MKYISSAILCATLTAANAHAGFGQANVIVQFSEFNFDVHQANTPAALNFEAFDTMGGTRLLTGVTIDLKSSFTLGMLAENGEDYAIGPDDWFVEAGLFNNIAIGETIFNGVGGTGYGPLSAALEASDGVSQSGADSVSWYFEGGLEATRQALPFQMSAFVGSGQLDAEIYPFLSLLIPPPEPFFDLWVTEHTHTGGVSLTYTYEIVPAPSGTAALALGGFIATRRRRT